MSRVGLTSPCSPPPATVAAFHCTQFTDWSPVGGGVPKTQPRKKEKRKNPTHQLRLPVATGSSRRVVMETVVGGVHDVLYEDLVG